MPGDLARADAAVWHVATLLVLGACVLVILGAAIAFVVAILGGDRDEDADVSSVAAVPDPRPLLDAAARTSPPIARVRGVWGGDARLDGGGRRRSAAKGFDRSKRR